MKKTLIFLVVVFGIVACTKKHNTNRTIKDISYNKAESLFNNNSDSAFYYFNKVATNSRDSLKIAKSYNYMAVIQSDAGDYFGSEESLLTSLKFLNDKKDKDVRCISSNYSELGFNNFYLKNYDHAITYFDLALKFCKNDTSRLIILNNQASAYQSKKEYSRAIKMYSDIISKNTKDKKQYTRVLTNISFTKWLQNSNYNPQPELLKALSIREKENDLWGQNSSYAHLADYYTVKQPSLALLYARRMYETSKKIKSPNDRREALQKLIKLSPAEETKQFFIIYQKLDDSLQTARNAAKNQFALIRYEAEKNKVDNLNLQKDNTEKKYQIVKQEIIIFITFLLIVAGSIISVLWYKKRKQRLELQAQNTIRENQLKTSKKVHDVVANGLYRVMTEIENQDDLDRDNILDKLEVMYEKSRDISYEEVPFTGENFHEEILDLLKSFANEGTRVVYTGSTPGMWEEVTGETKYEIQHILQELMVNMQKHSQASNVAIKFENLDNHINIRYTDDGVGISKDLQFNNGLTNTGNRIKSINGTITFDTKSEKGFKVYISFPVC